MIETASPTVNFSKKDFAAIRKELDKRIAELQRELRAANIPMLVVFEGWDASGKGAVLSHLLMPLDPRGFRVRHIHPPTKLELMYPPLWRFWRLIPGRGQIALFNHSWYTEIWNGRAEGDLGAKAIRAAEGRIRDFERQLTDDGMVLVKLFLHIDKKEQAKRFEELQKDPAYAWKVGKAERQRHRNYGTYYSVMDASLQETHTENAPWTVVATQDERHAVITVARTLVAAMETALARHSSPFGSVRSVLPARTTQPLDAVDLGKTLALEPYSEKLPGLQAELRRLQHIIYQKRRPVIMVFEGWDAAGKGGAIRRLTQRLDPRGYDVMTVAAPAGDERNHHYLWRFWRDVPKAGHFCVFDRSWYGRVLVERVEGFATETEWARAYGEINEFESQLHESGALLFKFWVHISQEVQLERFKAREENPFKRWKITDEDWRNRNRWNDYYDAVSDMIEFTSTPSAPWTILEGNDKRYARIHTLQAVVDGLSAALD
ncbi:MAG: hypothetical protein AMXMBFR84_45420 [Candidatus Hydrogenedentota bacterium]